MVVGVTGCATLCLWLPLVGCKRSHRVALMLLPVVSKGDAQQPQCACTVGTIVFLLVQPCVTVPMLLLMVIRPVYTFIYLAELQCSVLYCMK
jgi:hypothetical protein